MLQHYGNSSEERKEREIWNKKLLNVGSVMQVAETTYWPAQVFLGDH